MKNLSSIKRLNDFLVHGDLDKNPYELDGFIEEISEFTAGIQEVDHGQQIQVREQLGIPVWTTREQVRILLGVVSEIVEAPISEEAVDYLDGICSFYNLQECTTMPTSSESYATYKSEYKSKNVSLEGFQVPWQDFRARLVQYFIASKDIQSDDLYNSIFDGTIKYGGDFGKLTLQTKTRIYPDGKVDVFKEIFVKLHQPSLHIKAVDPIDFATTEYRTRMHELTHVLGFSGVLQSISEYFAEAIAYFVMRKNGLWVPEDTDSFNDDRFYAADSRAGRLAAKEAMNSDDPVKFLRQKLLEYVQFRAVVNNRD